MFEIIEDSAATTGKFKFEVIEEAKIEMQQKILALLEGSCSNKPVDHKKILALGKTAADRRHVQTELDRLCNVCEVMSCTITKNGHTGTVFWRATVTAPFQFAGGRLSLKPQNPPRRTERH